MPKLISPNSDPAVYTDEGAHHYRFIGVEFGVATGKDIYHIVSFDANQSSLAQSPHDLIIDRCYIHGDGAGAVRRGVALNCARGGDRFVHLELPCRRVRHAGDLWMERIGALQDRQQLP